jgi:hypothetical protein
LSTELKLAAKAQANCCETGKKLEQKHAGRVIGPFSGGLFNVAERIIEVAKGDLKNKSGEVGSFTLPHAPLFIFPVCGYINCFAIDFIIFRSYCRLT